MQGIIIFTLLVGLSQASEKCPQLVGKYPFDAVKASGEWFVIAITPIIEEKVERCSRMFFNGTKDGGILWYQGMNAEGKKQGIKDLSEPRLSEPEYGASSRAVWQNLNGGPWNGVYDQTIIAMEYDSYGVVIACKDTFNDATKTFGRHIIADIVSRTPTMSTEKVQILKGLLGGVGVDPSTLQMVEHTECPS